MAGHAGVSDELALSQEIRLDVTATVTCRSLPSRCRHAFVCRSQMRRAYRYRSKKMSAQRKRQMIRMSASLGRSIKNRRTEPAVSIARNPLPVTACG
jgi:hypothetical protein